MAIRLDKSDDRTRVFTGLFLLLIGVGLLAHPLYLWPHYGEQGSTLYSEQLSEPPDQYVEFESLPLEAQPVFRTAIKEGPVTVWSGEDAAAYDALIDMGLLDNSVNVRYQGEYYQVYMAHGDMGLPRGFLRWFLTAGAAFLIVYGAALLVGKSMRPFTPQRALWLPAIVMVAFYATKVYDVKYGGAGGSVLEISPRLLMLIPLASLFFVVGSEVATNGPTSRRLKVAAFGTAVVGAGSLLIIHPVAIVGVGAILTLFGLPWLVLGLSLTKAE